MVRDDWSVIRSPGVATPGLVSDHEPLRLRQRPLHLLDAVSLDDVADLDVVVAGDLDTALEALADLLHVLLEALERVQADRPVHRRIDDHAAADDAHLGRTLDDALGH